VRESGIGVVGRIGDELRISGGRTGSIRLGLECYDGGTPAAELRMVETVFDDLGMFGEERVDGAAQVADAFAVNDADLKNAAFLAGGEVIENEVLHLARLEGVQVQHAINWQLDGAVFVHDRILPVKEKVTRERTKSGELKKDYDLKF